MIVFRILPETARLAGATVGSRAACRKRSVERLGGWQIILVHMKDMIRAVSRLAVRKPQAFQATLHRQRPP